MDALLPMADPLAEWDWLQSRCPLRNLRERIEERQVGAYRIRGSDAALILSVNTTIDTNRRALWVAALGGTVGRRPKENLRLMQTVLADCEVIARTSLCTADRIEPGERPDWKLRLLPMFGFRPIDCKGLTIMQK